VPRSARDICRDGSFTCGVTSTITAFLTRLGCSAAFLMDLGEFGGLFSGPAKSDQEDVFYDYTWSAALRIAGGADEVLKNQLAERVLGMPSEVRAAALAEFA